MWQMVPKIRWLPLMKKAMIIGIIFAVLSFGMVMSLIVYAANKDASAGHDAVIVLGAGLKGDKVPLVLSSRLDTAIAYVQDNPNALLVMSGGQGADELVSEAYAMKEYAKNKGIDENRIIMEDQSTSTGENITYSKAVLDQYFDGQDYSVLIVTSDFHVFRAGYCADSLNMAYETLASPANDALMPKYVVREYFAVLKYCLISI